MGLNESRMGFSTQVKGIDLHLTTAPDLFAPKAPDAGTTLMLEEIVFEPTDKVLDLGCGYGLVGVVAAQFVPAERIFLIDNDPNATEAARINLDRADAHGAKVILSDGFNQLRETDFTKIVSHPPYHSDFSVAKHFIEKGFNRLQIGGTMVMVTRRETWYRNKLSAIFGGVRVKARNGYFVFQAEKRSSQYHKKPNRSRGKKSRSDRL